MTVNIYSVVMSVTLFTVISTICSLFLVHTKSKHLWVVALILGLCFVRCFVPVEVNGSFTINCWEIYPELFDFMQYTLFRDITVGRLFYIVWLTGGIICLVRQIARFVWQARLIRGEKAVPADTDVLVIAKEATTATNCNVDIAVYFVSNLNSPVMIGFFKPRILLPEYTFTWKGQKLDYILRHEINHYKSGDLWIHSLLHLLTCFLWWNPAAYLLRNSVIQLLEIRNDDRVCHTFSDEEHTDYSSVLVNALKEALNTRKSTLHVGFLGHDSKSFLRQRIKILTSPRPGKSSVWKSLIIAGMCIALFAGSYSFILQPAYTPPKEEGDYSITPETAWLVPLSDGKYELWIDGNLVATISSESVQMPPFNLLPVHNKETSP